MKYPTLELRLECAAQVFAKHHNLSIEDARQLASESLDYAICYAASHIMSDRKKSTEYKKSNG